MNMVKAMGVGLVLLAAQLSAYGAEVALLRNGFSIRFERKEQTGNVVRLFTRGGFVDVPSSDIVSFEHDDTPELPATPAAQPIPPAPAAAGMVTPAPAQPASAAKPALSRAEL